MKKKERAKLLIFNRNTWDKMNKNRIPIAEYLSEGKMGKNMHGLMFDALRLVISELMLNNYYEEYPARKYTDEDFVKELINILANDSPPLSDYKANVEYVNKMRIMLWGHIKNHYKKMRQLGMALSNPKSYYVLTDKDMIVMSECLTVAFVECVLKERENSLLENQWKEEKTLKDAMPKEFSDYDDTKAFKMKDIKVVREHFPSNDGDKYVPWPGTHKNVYFWVELENEYAVGWNENPARGWSFPVKKL